MGHPTGGHSGRVQSGAVPTSGARVISQSPWNAFGHGMVERGILAVADGADSGKAGRCGASRVGRDVLAALRQQQGCRGRQRATCSRSCPALAKIVYTTMWATRLSATALLVQAHLVSGRATALTGHRCESCTPRSKNVWLCCLQCWVKATVPRSKSAGARGENG